MSLRRLSLCFLVGLLLIGPLSARAGDDDIRARIKAAGDAGKYDADLVVVGDWTDVRVRSNGIGTARHHMVVKILREGGIRRQSVQVFPFDPDTNRLELVAVRVYRGGDAVEEIPVDDPIVQPQTAYGIFWGTKQYLITVPGLAVGDAVETITEMTGFNVAYLAEENAECNYYGEPLKPPVPGHWHDEVHFWSEYPVIEKRYSVRISKDKPLQFAIYNGEVRSSAMLDGEDMVYTFEMEDLKPPDHETRAEPQPNVLPKLLLATLPTWQDKGKWLYEVSEPQFEADEAIKRKVAEVIEGLETDEEKYTALNHWVAENIRYAGTSRGMCEGYTVHRSIETFHDRCGVCKDKAGMLVTMLRVAGYDSFLVMTMARQRVDRVPADQFNHAVTCIRWPDGSLKLLDPTWMVKSRDNWSTLEPLQHVVFGLPEGKDLAQSPYFAPEECQATWLAHSVIDADDNLSGEVDFEAVGAPEGRIRRTLSSLHPSECSTWFERTFQRISPNASVRDLEWTDPAEFSGPQVIHGWYTVEGYALGNGSRRYLALPMMQTVFGDRAMYDLLEDWEDQERKFAVSLLATRLGHFEETIKLPAGWEAVELPDAVDIDNPAAGLKFEIHAEPGQIKYTCDLVVKSWLIPPEQYAGFREVMEKFKELSGHVVACEVEGARAQR